MKTEMQRIRTPLGDLQISLHAICSLQDAEFLYKCIDVIPFKPDIPPGMSVSGCVAAVASLTPQETIRNVQFCARLVAPDAIEASPETGEGLEAQSFRSSTHVLLVGTEDSDFLEARLEESIKLPESLVTYSEDSIILHLVEPQAGKELSLHFLAAWNSPPEPRECSCWYAVEQPHSALLSALGANRYCSMR